MGKTYKKNKKEFKRVEKKNKSKNIPKVFKPYQFTKNDIENEFELE